MKQFNQLRRQPYISEEGYRNTLKHYSVEAPQYDVELALPETYPISLVTGRQLHKHRQSGGATHDIQTILHIPDDVLNR